MGHVCLPLSGLSQEERFKQVFSPVALAVCPVVQATELTELLENM